MSEILLAIEHLHLNGIIYRDLKLENLIMDAQGHIAVTDFGLSKVHCDSSTTFCGTGEYMAPELIKGQAYGFSVDYWSFGILVYEMLVGKTPFFDRNRKLMFQNILNIQPDFSKYCSNLASALISGLLVKNPTERLGSGSERWKAIKRDSFFCSMDFDQLYERKILAPFRPEVAYNEVKYVPQTYLDMEAADSVTDDAHAFVSTNEFVGFQYECSPRCGGTV